MTHDKNYIVVGVVRGQPDAVISTATQFAERFGAELVCAFVDAGRYTVDERPDGTVVSLSIDPDLGDEIVEEFDPGLRTAISAVMAGHDVPWSVRLLAGDPAQELADLADELDAEMIVVGTREPGLKGSLHEFFNGSVSAHLAHRQHRPVIVVPLNPVGEGDALPWDVSPT